MTIFLLSEEITFPAPDLASRNGLLAVGGDLQAERLLLAYRMGIFPWYSENEPILWWSPDPRLVLFPSKIHISRRLRRFLRQSGFRITMDTDFRTVMTGCAQTRIKSGQGTWIDEEMITAYGDLHDLGYAHSVEVWKDGVLCGGLYGVSLGRCFFGESMFSGISGASKAALIALARHLERHAFTMIDCQTQTRHLMRMGAQPLPRSLFLSLLKRSLDIPAIIGKWNFEIDSDFDGFFKIRS